MKRSTLILILSLLAALGIAAGLALHVGQEWYDDRKTSRNQETIPGRYPLGQFVEGVCGEDPLSLNDAGVANHLNAVGADLNLTDTQVDLIGQLILGRAQALCDIRLQRAAIREQMRDGVFDDPATARPFMESLLDLRQSFTEETLKETRLQRQLLASFTDEQLEAIDARTLPRLIPGLSLREFVGQFSGGRVHQKDERHR